MHPVVVAGAAEADPALRRPDRPEARRVGPGEPRFAHTREEQVRGLRDVVRFNLSTIQASGFEQYTFGLGFRF